MSTPEQTEIVRLDGELTNARAENERLRARLDTAYIEGWKKGVVESIDKLMAYQASSGYLDWSPTRDAVFDKAIELLTLRFAHPPEAQERGSVDLESKTLADLKPPEPQAIPIAVFAEALEKSREQTIDRLVDILVGFRDYTPRDLAEAIYDALAKKTTL